MASYIPIFLDWTDTTEMLSDAEKGRLVDALVRYARGEFQPDQIKGNERFLFAAMRGQVDRHLEKVAKLRENGAQGGRPKANETNGNQTKANETNQKQMKANNNNNNNHTNTNSDTNTHNQSENDNDSEKGVRDARKRATFAPPTVEDVAAYCAERRNGIDPDAFVAYYETRGWFASGRLMRDWKAAVRTWEAHDKQRGAEITRQAEANAKARANPAVTSYSQHTYTSAEANDVFTDLSKYEEGTKQ